MPNGKEALSAMERGRYDAVIMDCEMPEMDGYAATREIRSRGGRQLPIIALTAHALPGDREKALTAGMNDYLAKPVRMEDFRAALARWIRAAAPAREKTRPRKPSDAPVDQVVLDKLGTLDEEGGPDVLEDILRTFLMETQKRLDQLAQNLADKDLEKIRRGAHLIRGGSLTLGATKLGKLCQKLEEAARDARLDDVGRGLAETREEFSRVRTYLSNRPASDEAAGGR